MNRADRSKKGYIFKKLEGISLTKRDYAIKLTYKAIDDIDTLAREIGYLIIF